MLGSVQEEFSYVVKVEACSKSLVSLPLKCDPGIPCAQPAAGVYRHHLMLVCHSFS
jgi:hypothetical protein